MIPRFDDVVCGVEWFRKRSQWESRDYEPRPGNLIFLDWEQDGIPDHVGIVTGCDGGTVSTIEGNAGDSVCAAAYAVGSVSIYGYGAPGY